MSEIQYYDDRSCMPERMNEAPVVFNGCTLMESVAITSGSFLLWLFFGLPIGIVLNVGWMMVGSLLLFTALTTLAITSWLRTLKRGHTRGYFAQRMNMRLEDWGIGVSHLFRGNGRLELGRTRQYLSPRRLYRSLEEGERGMNG